MKKIIVSIIILVLVMTCALTLLTACKDKTDYEHTIVFYSTQGDKLQNITKVAIENFKKKFPGWDVKHTTSGDYDKLRKKITADFGAKSQPDLAYCYADHVAQYIKTGKVVKINELINSDQKVKGVDVQGKEYLYPVNYTADIAKIDENYLAEGYAKNYGDYATYGFKDNDLLTLPFIKSTELLYYNKTALDELGLTVPETWDEMYDQFETIHNQWKSCTPLGYDSEANWFITMCEQNGWGYTSATGDHFLFNTENHRAFLRQLNEFYTKGYITTKEAYDGYTSNLFTQGPKKGGVVYVIGSSGGASYQATTNFTWGIAPIPGSVTDDGINKSAISQGPSLVMLRGGNGVTNTSEKEIMTFMFIKELLDPKLQASYSIQSGYNPCRLDAYDIEEFIEHLDDTTNITAVASAVAKQMQEDRVFFTSPAFDGSSTARDVVGTALLKAMKGDTSPEKALRDAISACGG